MRRAICAVYVERWEDRPFYRKHNGLAQFYYEHVSQRCGEDGSPKELGQVTSVAKQTDSAAQYNGFENVDWGM
jgi:hypothetical protein